MQTAVTTYKSDIRNIITFIKIGKELMYVFIQEYAQTIACSFINTCCSQGAY